MVNNSLTGGENTDLFSDTPFTLGENLLKASPIFAFEAGSEEFVRRCGGRQAGECELGEGVEPEGRGHSPRDCAQ